jgi:hypothetical protein
MESGDRQANRLSLPERKENLGFGLTGMNDGIPKVWHGAGKGNGTFRCRIGNKTMNTTIILMFIVLAIIFYSPAAF